MSTTLAVEQLFARVVARFAHDGTTAVNVFGWREVAKHVEGNRIAWVPGDPTGKVGATTGARSPGRNPRPLATLRELFTIWISASDLTATEDELAQYKAVRVLRDQWYRAVYLAAHGTFYIRDEAWETRRLERRHGATLRIVLELEAAVLDQVVELAPVDTAAEVTLSIDDTSDPLDVYPAPEVP